MRKFLISAAVAAASLAVAAPAAAQWAPAPQYGYGYNNGYPQGYAYGYNNAYGQTRKLQARIDQVQRQIYNLDRRNILSNREARSLNNEARNLEYRLRRSAMYGLNWNEQRDMQIRIARLEQRVFREARDRDGWRDNRWGNNGYYDRDRDGRDDRYEDDRGWDRD